MKNVNCVFMVNWNSHYPYKNNAFREKIWAIKLKKYLAANKMGIPFYSNDAEKCIILIK